MSKQSTPRTFSNDGSDTLVRTAVMGRTTRVIGAVLSFAALGVLAACGPSNSNSNPKKTKNPKHTSNPHSRQSSNPIQSAVEILCSTKEMRQFDTTAYEKNTADLPSLVEVADQKVTFLKGKNDTSKLTNKFRQSLVDGNDGKTVDAVFLEMCEEMAIENSNPEYEWEDREYDDGDNNGGS